jgi:hypothetical protein
LKAGTTKENGGRAVYLGEEGDDVEKTGAAVNRDEEGVVEEVEVEVGDEAERRRTRRSLSTSDLERCGWFAELRSAMDHAMRQAKKIL